MLVVVLGLLAVAQPDTAACASVPHLVLDVELGDDHVLRGSAEWRYVNRDAEALDELPLALLANAEAEANPELSALARAQGYFNAWEPGGTTLADVTVDGVTAPWAYVAGRPTVQAYSLDRLYASVRLPQPLAPGSCVTVALRFATRVPHRIGDGGHYNGDTTYRFGWFPLPRHRAGGVWSDAFVLTGFTHVTRFKAPVGQQVVLGGERLRRDGGYFLARADVPVRSVPFVVSDRLTRASRTIDGVRVNVYTYGDAALLDTSAGEAREKLDQLARILPYFRLHFGPLRYQTLQILESPLSNVGMAADGLVLLGDMMFIYDRSWIAWGLFRPIGELTLAHEVAHQWWGIGVGNDFDAENWLSESMSQQMMFAYSRARFGADGQDYLSPNWFIRWVVANLAGAPLPTNMLNHEVLPSYTDHDRFAIDDRVVGPQAARVHAEESSYLVYQKGFLAVRGLTALLGPSGLEATMRALYADRAGEVITTDDFVAAAAAVTGVDVGPYVEHFMRGVARADLSVASVVTTARASGYRTTVQVRRDGDLVLPATVALETPAATFELTWSGEAPTRTFVFDTDAPPLAVTIDPEGIVPDPNRANNHWPPQTHFELFAPQRNPDGTTYSFNPLPIHRHYVAGLSFGGVDFAGNRAWTGLGLSGLGYDADDQRRPYYAGEGTLYGELALPTSRRSYLSALVLGRYRWDRDSGDYGTAQLSLARTQAIYEATDVGAPGGWALPRTTLTTEVGVSVARVRGAATTWTDTHVVDGGYLYEGPEPYGRLTLRRDERLKLGATFEAAVAGGTNTTFGWGYGLAELASTWATVVPWVGELTLTAHGYAGSRDLEPLHGRPLLQTLPLTGRPGRNPYDLAGEGGVRLRLPILRDQRVKNELTLGLFVWNDLFLALHYGAARGTAWLGAGRREPWRDLGEVGVGVGLGIGFLATPLRASVGLAVPTWPAPTRWSERGWFVLLGT